MDNRNNIDERFFGCYNENRQKFLTMQQTKTFVCR